MGEDVTPEPGEQLTIFAAEVVREREDNVRRQANMHTRAGVLIAAAGIVTGLHLGHPSGWSVIPAALALATAVLGLVVLLTRSRDEPVMTQQRLDGLGGFSVFQVRYSLVRDQLIALVEGRELLQVKARLINVGYVLLAASWTTQLIVEVATSAGS